MADHDTHDHTGVPGVGGSSDLDAIITASAGQDIADALAGAAAPDSGNVFATMADVGGGGGGLVLLEQHTASSSATLDFTTCLSSTYDDYLIEFIDLVPATNSVGLFMRVGTGGGPTYDTGSNYAWAGWRFTSGAASGAGGNPGTTSFELDGGDPTTVNTSTISGTLKAYGPQAGVARRRFTGQFSYVTGASGEVATTIACSYIPSTVITAFRFLFGSGNIASGTIRVYGLAK